MAAAAATAAAAAIPPDAGNSAEPALSDRPDTASAAPAPSAAVSQAAADEEKPSLSVLLCFLSFFAYSFVVWFVTSRVERAELPNLAQLEADTYTAVSPSHRSLPPPPPDPPLL